MRTLLVALALVIPATARAEAPACPATLAVKQSAEAPAGWTATADGKPVRLAGVTFYDGPLAEQASLAPDGGKGDKKARKETQSWRFAKPRPRPIWLECIYERTAVTLSRVLPDAVAGCTVTYRSDARIAGYPEILKIDCR